MPQNFTDIIGVTQVAAVFFILLAAATVVERVIRVAMVTLDFFEPVLGLPKLWRKLSEAIQKAIVRRLAQAEQTGDVQRGIVLRLLQHWLLGETRPGQASVLRVEVVRKLVMATFLQLIGFVLGVVISLLADLNVFARLEALGVLQIELSKGIEIFLTGLLVGSGTEPLYQLIKWGEHKKEQQKTKAAMVKAQTSG